MYESQYIKNNKSDENQMQSFLTTTPLSSIQSTFKNLILPNLLQSLIFLIL